MENRTLTVTQLTDIIKLTIDSSPYLGTVAVSGEISNFNLHYASGHMYFTLKDEGAQLKCVMFRYQNVNLRMRPENGMKVLCTGKISVYPQDGRYQLYVSDIIPDGIGALYVEAERIRKKLESEGLFSEKLKRKIPEYPQKIGVITSQTGAAVRDIINIVTSRFPVCELIVYPAVVQGAGSLGTLVEGIAYFNERERTDVIIIGRGGGSIEDLQSFNTEEIAYAIRRSTVPVISAVGHETDFTICDFAADLRASTPSHAAELAVPDSAALRRSLLADLAAMRSAVEKSIAAHKARLDRFAASKSLTSVEKQISDRRQRIDALGNRMADKLDIIMLKKKKAFETAAARLEASSPLRVLSSGYAYIEKDGVPQTSARGLKKNDKITVTMKDGTVFAGIDEVRINGE